MPQFATRKSDYFCSLIWKLKSEYAAIKNTLDTSCNINLQLLQGLFTADVSVSVSVAVYLCISDCLCSLPKCIVRLIALLGLNVR